MMNASNVRGRMQPQASVPETTQPQEPSELDYDYLHAVLHALARLGVPGEVVDIEIASFGSAPDGRQAYGVLLKVVHWDKAAVVRLLLGPALLETAIRKNLAETWLPEVSVFAGLWVRLSTRLNAGPGGAELKALIAELTAESGGGGKPLNVAARRPNDQSTVQ